MRGTIVTVLDLGARLDPDRAAATGGSILLVRHRERLVGLVVDEVLDVRSVDAPDDTDGAADGGIVRQVATVDDGAVVMLDLDVLISQVLLS